MLKTAIEKGFAITRNVNLYLHKPLKNKENYFTPEKLIQALKDQELIVQHEFVPNDVVDAGEIWIAELLAQRFAIDNVAYPGTFDTENALQYISIGTGSTPVAFGQYDLVTPIGQATASKTVTTSFNAGADNKFTITVTYPQSDPLGLPYSLREAGIFAADRNADVPAGTDDKSNRMFNRTVFSVITKTTDFELTIQWTIEIGALGS